MTKYDLRFILTLKKRLTQTYEGGNALDNKYLMRLKTIDTSELAYRLESIIRPYYDSRYYKVATLSSAYVLYKSDELKCDATINEITSKANIPENILSIIEKYTSNISEKIYNLKGKYSVDELLAFILFDTNFKGIKYGENNTPFGLAKLADEILSIEQEDTILNLCSGTGDFETVSYKSKYANKYTGVELDFIKNEVSEIRKNILDIDAEYIQGDTFEIELKEKYDKVFSNYPFSVRIPNMYKYKEYISRRLEIDEDILRKASSDWIYNSIIVSYMKDEGKAVAIMTNGGTWNKGDEKIRKYFIDNGLIEAVISLPSKLFNTTTIPTTMIVFSKNNHNVRMINATDLCLEQRVNNIIDDEHIRDILKLLNHDSDISITKSIEDIEKNDYIINPVRYLEILPEIKNGVEFGTVIKNITRGSQLKASDLVEIKSEMPTPYKYLMLSNIKNGMVTFGEDEQYLNSIPEKYEKYCVPDNSIVISKIGSPNVKSAVVHTEENKKLLANGNLFVIEVDDTKVDPYFIQAFFVSELGIATFKSILSGGVISSISMDKLKKIIIPLPDISIQRQIANQYKATIDEIKILNRKLERANSKLSHIYDMGDSNC